MATIRDVAQLANVSVATVSRVLNGNYPVSQEKKKAVMKAVKQLNFTPNLIGRNLGRSDNRTILVISNTISSVLAGETLRGINEVANEQGYDVLMAYLPVDPDASQEFFWQHCKEFLRGGLAGGAILLGAVDPSQVTPEQIGDIPIVQCGEGVFHRTGNCVTYDNAQASYELTCDLIQRGCRRFSYVLSQKRSESAPSDYSLVREEGMRRALEEAGLPYDFKNNVVCVQHDDFSGANSYEDAVAVMAHYIALPPEQRPDAILCSYDTLALACVHTLQRAGIRVPEDVAVVGFDDSAIATYSLPAITSVRQPSREMSREATRLLIDLMQGKRANGVRILLPCSISHRGSTDVQR